MARRKVEVRREEILRATVDEVTGARLRAAPGSPTSRPRSASAPALVFYHFETKDALLVGGLRATPSSATSRGSTRPSAAAGRAVRPAARGSCALYGPEGARAGLAAVDRRLGGGAAQPRDARGARGGSTALEGHRAPTSSPTACDAASSRCADPSAAAWRITALLDGLAVQATVHAAALTRDAAARLGARGAAAAELGVRPRDAAPDVSTGVIVTPASSTGGRARSAPAGRAANAAMSDVGRAVGARSASSRPNVGANLKPCAGARARRRTARARAPGRRRSRGRG